MQGLTINNYMLEVSWIYVSFSFSHAITDIQVRSSLTLHYEYKKYYIILAINNLSLAEILKGLL